MIPQLTNIPCSIQDNAGWVAGRLFLQFLCGTQSSSVFQRICQTPPPPALNILNISPAVTGPLLLFFGVEMKMQKYAKIRQLLIFAKN